MNKNRRFVGLKRTLRTPGDSGFISDAPRQLHRSALVTAASRSRPIAMIALFVLAIFLFAPGQWILPPIDRDEARFVQATKQMHETGDYIDIRNQDRPRYNKPVGIYWLQAIATLPFGSEKSPIGAYRLPSFIGALVSVFVTWWAGLVLFGRRAAFLAALLFSASLLLGVEARLAKTDAALLATIITAQAILARMWMDRAPDMIGGGVHRSEPPTPLALAYAIPLWLAISFGLLIKGPVILMIVGTTVLGMVLGARRLWPLACMRPLVGLIVVAVVALPWYIAIIAQSGGAFVDQAILKDLFGKIGTGQQGHGAPPGAYFVIFTITAWPMAAFAILGIPLMVRQWRQPSVWFCLIWLVPSWLVFEAVTTKLPHYVLPLFPALALLAGAALDRAALLKAVFWQRATAILFPILPVVLGCAALGLPLYLEMSLPAGVGIAAVTAFAVSLFTARSFWHGRVELAALGSALTAGFLWLAVYQFAFPALEQIWISERLVKQARAVANCPDVALASAGYTEISLVFLSRTDTLLGRPEAVAEWLAAGDCRVAMIEARVVTKFLNAAAANAIAPVAVANETGFNFSNGKWIDITLYMQRGGRE